VAIERLEGTLKWRREFGVYDDSMADLVEPEVRFHKCFSPIVCNETYFVKRQSRGR
jgi:hypothetical protein